MIEFKIGYIGKEDDEVYKRAEEYFKEKNLNDDDFHIVIENITGMSAEEIEEGIKLGKELKNFSYSTFWCQIFWTKGRKFKWKKLRRWKNK